MSKNKNKNIINMVHVYIQPKKSLELLHLFLSLSLFFFYPNMPSGAHMVGKTRAWLSDRVPASAPSRPVEPS
jgi:hypothetical protein